MDLSRRSKSPLVSTSGKAPQDRIIVTLPWRPQVTFDGEERVDASDGLQIGRRDWRRSLAAPCIGGDFGQLEELAPRVAPAQSLASTFCEWVMLEETLSKY